MTRKAERAAEAAPLDPPRLFQRLAQRRGLVLAVSGGPDSTALMVLMAKWRERPPALVVCVDHGLRPESATEAETVAQNAARLGLAVRILKAPEPFPGGNLQDWARRVRYRRLSEAAHEAGFDTVVTAHHRDDQAETFLLRLARGSGVYGLAAMTEESRAGGVMLMRPLLATPRAALHKIAAESGLPVIADPSNEDPRFDRARLRAFMPDLAAHGLTAERLAETSGQLGRAAAALDHYTRILLRAHFEADRFGVVRGRAAAFAEVPEEVALRALALILKAVGGADYTPRLDRLEAVRDALLADGAGAAFKRTLHGVVIVAQDGKLVARREWGRDGLPDVAASPGETLVWDSRYRVEAPQCAGRLRIGPLGRSERRLRASGADRATLRTLPGLYQDGTLAAVPAGIFASDDGPKLAALPEECLVGPELGLEVPPS